ncbi:sensor histidine kinase [Micromonospora avicenniae]|uniref:sensor histidine kinase n=1 Tax=Micromonospora avicenniae TaxID=1198245 RepID=UPI00331DCCDB
MNVFLRLVTEPVRARTWRETGHLLLGPFVAVACLVALAAMLYAAVASITVVGLVALAAVVTAARGIGAIERIRVRQLLGLTIAAPPARTRTRPGLTGWVRDALSDVTGWRCLLYAVIAVPFGVAQAYVVTLWWCLALVTATYPLWYRVMPVRDGHRFDEIELASFWHWYPDRWPYPLLMSVIGLGGLLAAPWLVHGFTALDRLRLRLLTIGARHDEQVRTLRRRRDNAVEQAGAHLRRIERDLHDGAQVRMVALAMELGRAREELEQGVDPHQAAIRVATAHEEAKQALVELRELARGIYPAVLTDLGLDGAVPALIARCPIPVTADIDLDTRPPAPVEATAYFCIGELLANLSKHSAATTGWVRVRRSGNHLRVQVGDDGIGGAAVHPTGGLTGLTDRVDSIGGSLTISSPMNGPTLITVELPCGS